MNTHLEIKPGTEVTTEETIQIDRAKAREWKTPPISEFQKKICLFVLLKDEVGRILAQGQLIPISPVEFNGQSFEILGIGGIIANQKGQGYGKKLMIGIKDYLAKNGKIGIGFTGDNVIGFYEKCGFLKSNSLKRFIHLRDGQKITNTNDDWVFSLDPEDKFMKKVLSYPTQDILLPRDPDW